MSLSDDNAFLKVRDFLLDFEKKNYKFNFFSRKESVFKVGVSANGSTYSVAITVGKEAITDFISKADNLLNAEGLGWTK